MGSHHLNLKWRNHNSNLLSVFSQFLTSEAFADVTLACDGASLRAHKIILSACSPFFHSLFAQHPCQHPIVILKDVPYEDLKVLVDFMYNGEVNITQERLPSFLQTAESLKVKGLSESEAHNRVGPIIHSTSIPNNRPFVDKRTMGSPKPTANKKRKKAPSETSTDNRSKSGDSRQTTPDHNLNQTGYKKNSIYGDDDDMIDPMKCVETNFNEGQANSENPMPSLEAESSGHDRANASGPPVLPLGSEASCSTNNNNVLEVESYRQLKRMASLLHQGVPQLPLPFSFTLPMIKDNSRSGLPNCSNDYDDNEEDDEDDKFSTTSKSLDEDGNVNLDDVHELTRLPRHKKKDCIVCGNRALGIRRRSRQWCPGCNVGVHVHCFDQLVHYRRHSRRARSSEEVASITARNEELLARSDEYLSLSNARNESLLALAASRNDTILSSLNAANSRNDAILALNASRNENILALNAAGRNESILAAAQPLQLTAKMEETALTNNDAG